MRFLGRLLWLIITVSAVAAAMAFATANDDIVSLSLWPFGQAVMTPLWLLVLGSLGSGAILGGVIVWIPCLAIRARNWRLRQNLNRMEQRAIVAEEKLADATQPHQPHQQHAGAAAAGQLPAPPHAGT